ncbi:MAG: hypothetical protein ACYDEH_08350, partial [Acidimicrobiales bacterium]
MKAQKTIAFQGVIGTPYVAGTINVTNAKGTLKTFTVTATTKILRASNVKNTAILAAGDRVEVRALASAPTLATSVNILGVKAQKTIAFQGVIGTPYVAGTINVTNAKGTLKTFTVTATTKILRASNVKNTAILAA